MSTARPRGTNDILPGEIESWYNLEETFRRICLEYGYAEIRTPIFEHTELFERGVGETTDIVSKEMYTFLDRSNRSITLRPEGTAPVVRAFLEHNLQVAAQPTKLYYMGPMFRYDRPQAGRLRQFHQFGVEVFGSEDPALDAEVIVLAIDFFKRVGLNNLELHLNSVGCPQCRPGHRKELERFLRDSVVCLCSTCQERFQRNPMRVLDCKNNQCRELVKEAPTTTQYLCEQCSEHLQATRVYLEAMNVNYVLDEYLVRGLDYYTRTTFEIMVPIGAQNTIGAGGRYDYLVKACGGPEMPGIGFGLGVERILLSMEAEGLLQVPKKRKGTYIIVTGEELKKEAVILLQRLRKGGQIADLDYLGRSVKAQFKQADRRGARYAIVLGEREWNQGLVGIRDLANGNQTEVPREELLEKIQKE